MGLRVLARATAVFSLNRRQIIPHLSPILAVTPQPGFSSFFIHFKLNLYISNLGFDRLEIGLQKGESFDESFKNLNSEYRFVKFLR